MTQCKSRVAWIVGRDQKRVRCFPGYAWCSGSVKYSTGSPVKRPFQKPSSNDPIQHTMFRHKRASGIGQLRETNRANK